MKDLSAIFAGTTLNTGQESTCVSGTSIRPDPRMGRSLKMKVLGWPSSASRQAVLVTPNSMPNVDFPSPCAVSLYWSHLSDIPPWRSWCLSGNLVVSCSKFLCSLRVACVHPWLHFTPHCLLLSASFPALPPPVDYKLLRGLDLISWHHLGHPAHWHPQQLSWLWNWMQLTWSRAPHPPPRPVTLILWCWAGFIRQYD